MMEWILRSPQVHSAFASLGHMRADVYCASATCNSTLEEILQNILSEDKILRNYRRTISFSQYVKKDLAPLLIHSNDDITMGLLINILTHLTVPVDFLLPVEVLTKTDFGRHTIFEIKNLLSECKNVFIDPRATKVVIDFLKRNTDDVQDSKHSESVQNCLSLLRNVLNVGEEIAQKQKQTVPLTSSVQNQISWNLFSQGLDKIVIRLMTVPEAYIWSETMVQLIALLYKNQHVGKIQKLLNTWLDASLSESSEDNESNTSLPDRGTSTDSPNMTTDQMTSESSDNSPKAKRVHQETENISNNNTQKQSGDATAPPSDNSLEGSEDETTKVNKYYLPTENATETHENDLKDESNHNKIYMKLSAADHNFNKYRSSKQSKNIEHLSNKRNNEENITNISNTDIDSSIDTQSCAPPPAKIRKEDYSDCGYATQVGSRESLSTSSNDDDLGIKPVHVKPQHLKQKVNTKARINTNITNDRRRKKLVKRGKSNILNVQGLQYRQPTDDDIALVLKEFTVDFMLKGYSSLVSTLHKQILSQEGVEVDRSHFFWLVSYFLKFATQMELDFEQVDSVLSFDVISFLIAEGVNLCEKFELAIQTNSSELIVCRRKLHLAVTAIREFVQAVDSFVKIEDVPAEGSALRSLQLRMWETEELRSVMVLLIGSYNRSYHDKQYLQDLVVTNHLLLLFLDNVIRLPGYTGKLTMIDHLKQFASPLMMQQYGALLEDYQTNGEFVNDCGFTIMHHVSGDVDSVHSLYQPKILRTFMSIKESEYEICDHWTDLVEYVVNSFARRSQLEADQRSAGTSTEGSCCRDSGTGSGGVFARPLTPTSKSGNSSSDVINGWSENELSKLSWNYMQSKQSRDVIGNIANLYRDYQKSRNSIVRQLYAQGVIGKKRLEGLVSFEKELEASKSAELKKEELIESLCQQLIRQGHDAMLSWVQNVLLEVCYVKICLAKHVAAKLHGELENFTMSKLEFVLSPVAYHNILHNRTIPLVHWNCEQAAICKNMIFLQLLALLDFEMPMDSEKLFIRIPNLWTADVLYQKATKLHKLDTTKLKFSLSDISEDSLVESCGRPLVESDHFAKNMPMLLNSDNCYRIQRIKQIGAMRQYTPTPGVFADTEIDVERLKKYPTKDACCDLLDIVNNSKMEQSPPRKTTLKSSFSGKYPSESEPSGTTKTASNGTITRRDELDDDMSPKHNAEECSASGDVPIVKEDELVKDSDAVSVMSEDYSVCETTSVASDFCRMYVSDEEDRG